MRWAETGLRRVLGVCVMVACLGGGETVLAQKRAQKFPLVLDRPELINARIENAIENGINYLLLERQPEGHWESSRSSRRSFPCANTALVGLALLANGNTPTRGPHARVVRDITDQLLDYSTSLGPETGLFQAPNGEYRPMYSHAFAMTFLATVFGQEGGGERRKRIRDALRRGINLCRRAQSPDGGWGYYANYEDPEGTLVVTQLMGLRACREAGIPVSKRMIENAIQFIRDSTRSDGMVRYRAHDPRPTVRKGVTCAAVVALWQAGEYDTHLTRSVRDRVLASIAPYTGQLWSDNRHGEYVEYYLAQVMWIQGGQLWKQHYRQLTDFLVEEQAQDGSWYGRDSRGYGEIYSTTMALLILQLPYKRLPIFQR